MKLKTLRMLRRAALAGAWCAMMSACRSTAVPPPPAGGSDFVFVEPPVRGAGAVQASLPEGPRQPADVFVRATPILPLAKPVYPSEARGRVTIPMLVGVRVVVDASGRVERVDSSLRALSTAGPFAAEFQAAVAEALQQWRFTPAERRHLVPGTNDMRREDYWLITRADQTEDAFDVAFTFSPSGEIVPALAH